ncbi:MAG: S41 family peptidase [Planctomycetota bacterium]
MPSDSEPGPEASTRSPRYLPYLTWVLLALLVAYSLVWFFFYRPTSEEERQIASFAAALRFVESAYVEEADRGRLYRSAMHGMLAGLGDKYSQYLTPEQMRRLSEQARGEYAGIGVRISRRDGIYAVEEVFEDGPAAESGVEAGDIIARVEGVEASELNQEQLVSAMRGEPGTAVRLALRRPPEGREVTVRVPRRRISIPNVTYETLEDGVGRLRIAAFDTNVAGEVADALDELNAQGGRALMLDLRSNSGGVMGQAEEVCDMFLSGGIILQLVGRNVKNEPPVRADEDVRLPAEAPVVVLVDQWTASAAEIVAGALQANGRAPVVGTSTLGKGSVTQVQGLPDDSAVILTVARYQLAGGRIVEGQGVRPDVEVGELPPFPMEELQKAEQWHEQRRRAMERQQERALQILRQKLSPSATGPGAAAPPRTIDAR